MEIESPPNADRHSHRGKACEVSLDPLLLGGTAIGHEKEGGLGKVDPVDGFIVIVGVRTARKRTDELGLGIGFGKRRNGFLGDSLFGS